MMNNFICNKPFKSMSLGINYYPCCNMFLKEKVKGDVYYGSMFDDPTQAFNSDMAIKLRKTILNKTYEYCQKCPFFLKAQKGIFDGPITPTNKIKTKWLTEIIEKEKTFIEPESVPLISELGYDNTCNLKCSSCRKLLIQIKPGTPRYKKLINYQEKAVKPWLKKIQTAFVTGGGDPFASNVFYKLLTTMHPKDYPNLKLFITTNGLLLKNKWENVSIKNNIEGIWISIDAATEYTYKLNRGANFKVLKENLDYISKQKIPLTFRYVVQRNNWHEMEDFVEMANFYGAKVIFMAIRPILNKWSVIDKNNIKNEWLKKAVWLNSHPNHLGLKNILKKDIFQNEKIKFIDKCFYEINPELVNKNNSDEVQNQIDEQIPTDYEQID